MLLLCSYSKVCILRKGVNNIYSEFFFFTFYSKSPATSVVRENTAMFDIKLFKNVWSAKLLPSFHQHHSQNQRQNFHFWVNCSKVLAVPSWEKLPFLINLPWHLDRAPDWFLQLFISGSPCHQHPVTLLELAESRRYFDLFIWTCCGRFRQLDQAFYSSHYQSKCRVLTTGKSLSSYSIYLQYERASDYF